VDKQAMTCRLPFGPQEGGMDLPLAPFFGVMGVAPPPDWGTLNTKEPRAFGGNLDNKELTEGTTLYLPVFNEGALFSAGDGHGVQGDGEVCINALEICLTGHFRLSLVKGGGAKDPVLKFPRAETKTHYITMGMNEDLDLAMKQALREMIAFICSRTNLSDADAYQFCSLAVDFRVTQTVNGDILAFQRMIARTMRQRPSATAIRSLPGILSDHRCARPRPGFQRPFGLWRVGFRGGRRPPRLGAARPPRHGHAPLRRALPKDHHR